MTRRSRLCVVLLAIALIAPSADLSAAPPSFQAIHSQPQLPQNSTTVNGISPDGTALAGQNFNDPFRWTVALGFDTIPNRYGINGQDTALATSNYGTFVVGQMSGPNFSRPAYRWSQVTGVQILGMLPGGELGDAAGTGISGDGSTVVGYSDAAAGARYAFQWTIAAGMVGLGDLSGGLENSEARAISGDGNTIVGFGTSTAGREAMRFTSGVMTGLGELPGGQYFGEAKALSADGSVIVGRSSSANSGTLSTEAFRWQGGSMVGLGDLPGGPVSSDALSISADGSIIVGRGRIADRDAAFIWDAVNGMRDLQTYLSVDLGLDLQGMTLYRATGISADGSVIVGQGINASGVSRGWRAVILDVPEPSTLALLAVGIAVIGRRNARAARR